MQLEDGKKITQKLINSKKQFDGIFSSSALGAMGALQICKQNGIAVPDQVAIVGFSNEVFSSFSDPTLTSVEQHSLQMGNAAAEIFFDQLQARAENQIFTPKKIVLTPTLIIRESSVRKKK